MVIVVARRGVCRKDGPGPLWMDRKSFQRSLLNSTGAGGRGARLKSEDWPAIDSVVL